MPEPLVRAEGISRTYGSRPPGVTALADASFEIAPGQTVSLMGPSGSGKSTLLHLIAGLDLQSFEEQFRAVARVEGMEIAFGSHPDDVYHVDEVGYLQLGQHRTDLLEAGEVGYMVASLRNVRDSRVGDTVFDPFMGTATTNVAAAKWGRNSIGVEVDPQYFEMAAKRIENELPKLFSGRTVRLHEYGAMPAG